MLSVALLLLAIVAAGALAYLRARFVALNAQQRASHTPQGNDLSLSRRSVLACLVGATALRFYIYFRRGHRGYPDSEGAPSCHNIKG